MADTLPLDDPQGASDHFDTQPLECPESQTAVDHIVELRNVSKWFDDPRRNVTVEVLKNLNLVIEKKEAGAFVVLLGPSGCGKSTILSLISGLALPNEGEVLINGRLVTGPDPDSATVPQAYTCFPWLTVRENAEFGLTLQGESKKVRRKIAMEYLRRVGLEDRADAYPKQLSGGMQQRVAIARTLAIKPPIVLMDEPFGALDAQTRSEMQQMVLKLWEEEKNTIIFVTHDITEALLLGDRVIVFNCQPIQGSPDNGYYEQRDLDAILEHSRPPEIVQTPVFIKLAEKLRKELRKHEPSQHP